MESLGQFLKKEREHRGIKIQEIANETNIGSGFLEALEEDNYDDLPGKVFVRGFLRAYANFVGLDAEDVLNRHSQILGSLPAEEPGSSSVPMGSNYFVLKFYFFICLFLGLLGYGGYQGFTFVFGPESSFNQETSKFIYFEPDIPPQEESIPADIPSEPGTVGEIQPEIELTEKPASGDSGSSLSFKEPNLEQNFLRVEEEENPGQAAGSPHKLIITAIQDTWLKVTIDGESIKDMILRKGESMEWTANERFNITTGNAYGTKVEFNGKPVQLPNTTTNVVRNFTLPPPHQETDFSG